MTLLALKDVHKSYGHREILSGVSLSIGEGERVGLVGPNGGGKSTLMRILAGREEFEAGERTRDLFFGRVMTRHDHCRGLNADFQIGGIAG